jgi:O-antigen/teichoic acid export membrane protein
MSSHRKIFRSSAIVGGSSLIKILIGIVKVKVLAVLLGPVGIGLMGIYQNIMSMAATIAGCGMGSSGVRQIATSTGEQHTLPLVRRALLLANLLLGIFGFLILWLFRAPIAEIVFGDTMHVREVGLLGFGVFLTLVASSQTALLQGLRRIDDLARVQIISALIGAPLGVLFVYLWGQGGVLWFVVTAPAVSVFVATYYAARIPNPQTPNDWRGIQRQWQAMLQMGIPFMGAALLTLATQLVARSIVLQELGVDASGYFQAAWAISMTYIGLVLGAMAADYYPRLTEVIKDHKHTRKLVREQTEMGLLLAGPVILAMLTLATWVVFLLYSDDFAPTVELLRWQVLGDIVKIACWPLGFILLAMGRGGIFFVTQLIWNFIYLTLIILGIKHWGLVVAGVGFLSAYMVLYGVQLLIAKKLIGYKIERRNVLFSTFLLLSGAGIVLLSNISTQMTSVVGIVITLLATAYSLRRLDYLIDLRGWLRQKLG